MSSTHTSIHDHFIRAILADKVIATEYFRNYLPVHVSSKLNFSTLTQIPDTYLSSHLRKSISDIVFSCEKNNPDEKAKICLLIEHKSYPDKYTPFRSGVIYFQAYRNRSKIKKNFPLLFPCYFITEKANGNIKRWLPCLKILSRSGGNTCQILNMFIIIWETFPINK